MISHTRQEWFELAVRGLAGQGWERSISEGGDACLYRGADGKRCAIGFGIPDAAFDPAWDRRGNGAYVLQRDQHISATDAPVDRSGCEQSFLSLLQQQHDKQPTPGLMRSAFLAFAQTHNLTWPADVAKSGEIK